MFWLSQPVRFHQFPRKGKIKELEWSTKCSVDVKTFVYKDEDVSVLRQYWLNKRPLDTPFFESTTVSFLLPLEAMIVSRPVILAVPGETVEAAVHEFWHGKEVVVTHEFRRGAPSIFIEEVGLPFSCLTDYEVAWIRTDQYPNYNEPCVKANASHARQLSELLTAKPCVVAPSLPNLLWYLELKRYSVFFTRGAIFVFKYKNDLMVDLVAAIIKDEVRAVRAFSTLMNASTFRVVRIHCNSDTKCLAKQTYKTTHLYLQAYNYFPPTFKSEDCLVI